MSAVVEQFNAVHEASLNVARQFFTIALDSTENAVKAALNATQTFIDQESGLLQSSKPNGNLSDFFTTWSNSFQESSKNAFGAFQLYVDNTIKAQGELARLVQDQVTNASSVLLNNTGESPKARLAITETEETLERKKGRKVTA